MSIFNTLESHCIADISDYASLGESLDSHGELFYVNNNSPVLGIAHLDTVIDAKFCYQFKARGREYALSPALDDRLGACILLDILPRMAIKLDILLTTGEESCNSTAQDFITSKQYNWLVQFDRAGGDTVCYQYESVKFSKLLKKYGFYIGIGSYSDICELSHLKARGFNIGVGYRDNHEINAIADLSIAYRNIKNFKRFYGDYKDIHIPYNGVSYRMRGKHNQHYGWLSDTAIIGESDSSTLKLDTSHCFNCGVNLYSHERVIGYCEDCIREFNRKGIKYA